MKKVLFAFSFVAISSLLLAVESVETSDQIEQKKVSEPQSKSRTILMTDESVISDLNRRQAELDEWKSKLEAKEKELEIREKMLSEKVNELQVLRDSIQGVQAADREKMNQRVQKLVEITEKMSPKAAAKMIGELEERLAVDVITKVTPERVGKIMNLIPSDKSARLSELMTLGVVSQNLNRDVAGKKASKGAGGESSDPNRKGGEKNGN